MKFHEVKFGYAHAYDTDWDSPDKKPNGMHSQAKNKTLASILDVDPKEITWSFKTIVSDDTLLKLVIANVDVTVEKTHLTTEDSTMYDRFKHTVDKLEILSKQVGRQFNERCEIHTPGNALTMYNATLLLEDICTDELQRNLNDGWRIIAVCPQPNQRRPDYILGKFDPDNY